jgi:rhodanese-related sulfurtransferase
MTKTLALSLVFLAPLVGCSKDTQPAPKAAAPATPAPTAATPTPAEPQKLAALTPEEVQKRLKEPNFFVFDNNSKERFDKGHVPGAKLLDPSTVTAAVLPADKAATLVFYCANTSCGACHEAAEAAVKLGYKNVYIMPAGIKGWEQANLPTEKVS